MKKIFQKIMLILFSLLFCSAFNFIKGQELIEEDEKQIENLLSIYTEAKNQKNYELIKPYISENCMPKNTFLELVFNENHNSVSYKKGTLSIIRLSSSYKNNRDTVESVFIQNYTNGFSDTANFIFIKSKNILQFLNMMKGTIYGSIVKVSEKEDTFTQNYKISPGYFENKRMQKYAREHNGSLEGYEFKKIKISKPKIIDISKYKIISDKEHKVYYEKTNMTEAAKYCLYHLPIIDSLIKKFTGIYSNFPIHDVLIKKTDKINYTIKEENIWCQEISVPEKFVSDSSFKQDFIWTLGHEITEDLLVKHNIKDENTRWYRDGMAEYIAYLIMNSIDPVFGRMHLKSRKLDLKLANKKTDLLEWGGSGDAHGNSNTIDKIMKDGEGISEIANYGRALFFFIDYYKKYGDDKIPQIHNKMLLLQNSVSSENIITIMNEVTGSDVKEMIKNY